MRPHNIGGMVPKEDPNTLSTLEKSFDIIELLMDLNGARVSEIAERLDIPKSTVHLHLQTLIQSGYTIKNGDLYNVSLKFLHIGGYALHQQTGFRVAQKKVKTLAKKTGERANFTIRENHCQYTLYNDVGEEAITTDVHIGQQTQLHTTASGKAILAHLSERKIEKIIEKTGLPGKTSHTITDPEELWEDIAKIRDRGFAYNCGERVEKQYAVGVPVFGENSQIIGGLSVAGPAHRMKGKQLSEEIPDLLLGAADDLQLTIIYE